MGYVIIAMYVSTTKSLSIGSIRFFKIRSSKLLIWVIRPSGLRVRTLTLQELMYLCSFFLCRSFRGSTGSATDKGLFMFHGQEIKGIRLPLASVRQWNQKDGDRLKCSFTQLWRWWNHRIRRRQLAITVLNMCLPTMYKAQGQTIDHVIVDLGAKPPTGTLTPFNAHLQCLQYDICLRLYKT
jgi:hypothetical protein